MRAFSPAALIWQVRRGSERAKIPAPPWDVFHLCRPCAAERYSNFGRLLADNYFGVRIG
jgi:hypothetical protein